MKKVQSSTLAQVRWVCDICGFEHFRFELYYETPNGVTSQCSQCNKITPHTRILPTNDNKKHYKRPTLF